MTEPGEFYVGWEVGMDDFETNNYKVVEEWRAQRRHRAERVFLEKIAKWCLFLLACAAFIYGIYYLAEQLA